MKSDLNLVKMSNLLLSKSKLFILFHFKNTFFLYSLNFSGLRYPIFKYANLFSLSFLYSLTNSRMVQGSISSKDFF